MDILSGLQVIKRKPDFKVECHGEKITRLSTRKSQYQTEMVWRRNEIISIVKRNPEKHNSKSLALLFDVSAATICADIASIDSIYKSTKAGFRHTYVYVGGK